MSKNWLTKTQDLIAARQIMENYARQHQCDALGIYELVLDHNAKRMDYRLSSWVAQLSDYFRLAYGEEQGDFVTRQVLTAYATEGQTVH